MKMLKYLLNWVSLEPIEFHNSNQFTESKNIES